MISDSTVLDVGSRTEKIAKGAMTIDIEKKFRPDVCGSADYLPFKEESFDYISMLEVIEHLDDDQVNRALAECKRVSSYLVLSTPNCDSVVWDKVVWPLWSHTIGREWIGAHKQFYGKASLISLLEGKFGMKVIEKNFSRWNLLVLAKTS